MKILLICSLPFALAHGGMQTQIETSEKLPSLVAAVGRPLHFSGKLKSAALCREAATPVLQRSQTEQTQAASQAIGLEVKPLRWWNDRQGDNQIHCFGAARNI